MTKQQVIEGMVAVIKSKAEKMKLTVEDQGTGNGFKGSIWEGILEDTSNVPVITAKKSGYEIELRPIWGRPNLCIRRDRPEGEELLVLIYSDSAKDNETGKYVDTGLYTVREVRADSNGRYKQCMRELYKIIRIIESFGICDTM